MKRDDGLEKRRRILMGFLNQNFASFFSKFLRRKKEKKTKVTRLFTSYFLGVRTKKKKEGRKETERIYMCVCVCPMYCV